jgi:hypothetical protein
MKTMNIIIKQPQGKIEKFKETAYRYKKHETALNIKNTVIASNKILNIIEKKAKCRLYKVAKCR